jgi:YVTN family beta-propeller protein
MPRHLFFLFLLGAVAFGQTRDTVVYLPDSLTGALYPGAVLAVPDSEKMYAAGTGGLPAVIAFDAATGNRTSRVRVAGDIERLIWNSSSQLLYALGRETLSVIDPEPDTLIATVSYGNGPGLGAWSEPAGALFVASRLYGMLAKLDGTSHQLVDSIAVPLTPVDIVAHADRSRLYVAGRQDSVAVIDVSADSLVRFVPVGDNPVDLEPAPDRDLLYCANSTGRSVSVVDCGGETLVATITIPSQPLSLAYDSGRAKLYCLGRYPDAVTVIDAGGNQMVTAIPVASPQSMALDRAHARLYAASHYGLLSIIDIDGDSLVAELPIGNDCPELAVSVSGRVAAVSRERGNVTLVVGESIAGAVQVATSGPRAALTAAGKLYVAEERAGLVDVLELPGYRLLRRIKVGVTPYALSVNRAEQKVYCACQGSNHVAVISTAADSLVATVAVGTAPLSLALDSAGNKLYVGNMGSTEVTVIDCRADTVVARVPVGEATRRVVYNAVSRKVYVACHNSETFYIIDCESDSVLGTVTTNGSPWMAVHDPTDNLIYGCTSWGGPVIDGATDSVLASLSEVFYVKGACWNPLSNLVYMSRNYDADVLVIDGPSHTVLTRVAVGEYPAEMASMTTSRRAWACHTYARTRTDLVSVVEDDSLVASFTVPQSPVNLFADSEHGKVYVTCWESSCLAVFDDGVPGIEQSFKPQASSHKPGPTIVRGVLRVADGTSTSSSWLLDAAGRKVLQLARGDNDVSRLGAGVYFVIGTESAYAQRVVVTH